MNPVEIPEAIIFEAQIEPMLNGVIPDVEERQPIYDGKTVVGFFTPKQLMFRGHPYWRAGATYVQINHRRKGLAQKALIEFFQDKPYGMAYIEPRNTASLKTFESVGFEKSQRFTHSGNGVEYWLMLKMPKPMMETAVLAQW